MTRDVSKVPTDGQLLADAVLLLCELHRTMLVQLIAEPARGEYHEMVEMVEETVFDVRGMRRGKQKNR